MNLLAETIKQEIMLDLSMGVVPYSVGSFAELHDYVDANCYGGLCDEGVANGLIALFGGRDGDGAMPDGMMAYINAAQNEVDIWIKTGRLK